MDTAEIVVTAGGVLVIALILWFFFGPRPATAAHVGGAGRQELDIVVQGGYSPDRIEVRQGRPVRLNFLRQETNPCTEQVIFDDFGIVRELPVGQSVPVDFTPDEPGEYTFHCGMNMVRGRLIVRPAEASPAGTRPEGHH
jgi:plastocyanin domain-containing protein